MVSLSTFQHRREALCALLGDGLVVLGGHRQLPTNLPMNLGPARQSSHILYLTGIREPDACVVIDVRTRRFEAFFVAPEPGDEVWHGPTLALAEMARTYGADAAHPLPRLEDRVRSLRSGRKTAVLTLPCADPGWATHMGALGVDLPAFGRLHRAIESPLADAMIALRLRHDAAGLSGIREAVEVTAAAFGALMSATRVGRTEAQLRGLCEGVFRAAGMRPSYDPIVTVRGEILHCRSNPHTLGEDDLLLVDAGCETPDGWAADVTRAWPARGRFDARQRDVYTLVLEAEKACISLSHAGTEYRDIHVAACRVIARGLVDIGVLRGDVDGLVEQDAHALFFPHGVGHLLGLDVHDLEDLGDRAGYAPGRTRSGRFGLGYLRLDRRLESDMVVTIEPGLYFIPGLLNDPALAERFRDAVDFDRARGFLGFGGVRIEDDVRVTDGEPEVLTAVIPREVRDVEEVVGSRLDAIGAIGLVR